MKKILVFALSGVLLASCASPSKDTIDESLVVPDSLKANNTTAAPAAPVQAAPVNGLNNLPQNQQPVVITPQQQVQPTTAPPVIQGSLTPPGTTTATATTSTAGLNPAHGQPGHRCDIAVGAPLNSKPAPVAVKPTTPTTTITPVNVPVTPTAPGMNPPHGQPGHRCDIAVGAPLSSAPATAPTPAPVTVPVTQESKPAATDTAKGGATGARGGRK